MLSVALSVSCFFLFFAESISTEQFVAYNYRVKSCPKSNWYTCIFKRERTCTTGGSNKFLCSQGAFFEEFNNCSYFESAKDFCAGGYTFSQILQFCESKCDNTRHEKVQFQCKSNPACSKIAHRRCSCAGKLGEWCQWSRYSECSASCDGGVKTKVRYKCREPIDGTVSSDCGSKTFKQTSHTQCNTFLCNWKTTLYSTTSSTATTKATTTSKVPITQITVRSIGPTCDSICDGALTNDLDIGKACSKTLSCDSNENVLLSCGKNPTCGVLTSSVCPIYRRWTSWSQWNAFASRQLRHRYQTCHHSVSEKQNECYKETILQTECKIIGQVTDQRWIIWLVSGLVALIVLLCCCGITCYCFGKKRRLSKQKAAEPSQILNGGPDDVFLQSGTNQVSDAKSSNRLGILDRLERISEHVYEAISGQNPRLLSRLSTAKESRRSTESNFYKGSVKDQAQNNKIENEYTGGNVSFRSRDENDRMEPQEYDVAQQSRVSVLVTDPDGMKIFEDRSQKLSDQNTSLAFQSTSTANPIDYVEMSKDSQSDRSIGKNSTSSTVQEKTQWERIPSPPSHESPKPRFFKEVVNEKDTNATGRSPRRLDLSASQATVTTAIDAENEWPPAPVSATDNISMWSESSFESANYSDWEDDQLSMNGSSYRAKNNNSRKSLDTRYLDDVSENGGKGSGYLAPGNASVVQYLSPRPGIPVKQKMKPPSVGKVQQGHEMLGTYLKMNNDRGTVKSWLNLRTAPVPQNNASETDDSYCEANELNGRQFRELKKLSREQSLDEKYTCTAEITNVAINQTMRNDVSIDTEGYFNVNYPEVLPRRLNTTAVRQAAKNAIRAPLPK